MQGFPNGTRRSALLSLVLVACGAACVRSQPPGLDKVAVDVVAVETRGTVLSVTPESVVLRADDQTYRADLKRTYQDGLLTRAIDTPAARIIFDWDETPAVLKRDMLVSFEVQLRSGRASERIDELTVINRVPLPEFGMTRIYDVGRESDSDEGRGRDDANSGKHVVVGRIVRFSRDLLAVDFPSPNRTTKTRAFQVRLADDTIVKLADITFAKRHDQIHVEGESAEGDRRPRFWATSIRISREGKSPTVSAKDTELAATSKPRETSPETLASDKPKDEPPAHVPYRGKILKIN